MPSPSGGPVDARSCGMISRTTAYRATVALIWALALWHSWTSRGLFVDGANFLVHVVRQEDFFDFYDPRRYAMIAGQIPVMTAITLGNTDLHLLARLLSLGLFGLPTIFYTLALRRGEGRPDPAGDRHRRDRAGVHDHVLLHRRRIQHALRHRDADGRAAGHRRAPDDPGRAGAGAARAAVDPHLRDHDLSRPAALPRSSCGRYGKPRRGRSIATVLHRAGRGVRHPRHDGRDLLGDPSPSAGASRGSLAVGDQFLAEPAVRPRLSARRWWSSPGP